MFKVIKIDTDKIKKCLKKEGTAIDVINLHLKNVNGDVIASNDGYYDEDDWEDGCPVKKGVMPPKKVTIDEAVKLITDELDWYIEAYDLLI